jgi:hypothetical protein
MFRRAASRRPLPIIRVWPFRRLGRVSGIHGNEGEFPLGVMSAAFAMSAASPVYFRLRKDCGSAATDVQGHELPRHRR